MFIMFVVNHINTITYYIIKWCKVGEFPYLWLGISSDGGRFRLRIRGIQDTGSVDQGGKGGGKGMSRIDLYLSILF